MKRLDSRFFERSIESWEGIGIEDLVGFLEPKCQKLLTLPTLRELLNKQEKVRVKFGIDPTASDIHIGHVVPIMLLRQFAKAGHHIDLIIGDFTARVGDPTARDTGRAPLTPEKIAENMKTYTSQVGKYIDLRSLSVHFNSEWLNAMTLSQIFSIFQRMNLTEAMQREDFRTRIRNSQAVSLAEVCYGVLMGIDSVKLSTQVEIGGVDQLLNFQQCRKVMAEHGMPEEVILMTPILEGTSGDGRKMSKSYGNYVAVNASTEDKFGKIMSIPDRLVVTYFRCFADVHQRELDELDEFISTNPLEAKKQLATLLVAIETKSLASAEEERAKFERKFSKRMISEEDCSIVSEISSCNLCDALFKTGQFTSKKELRRIFEQNGVTLTTDDCKLLPTALVSECSGIVRVGKRRYFKIVVKN